MRKNSRTSREPNRRKRPGQRDSAAEDAAHATLPVIELERSVEKVWVEGKWQILRPLVSMVASWKKDSPRAGVPRADYKAAVRVLVEIYSDVAFDSPRLTRANSGRTGDLGPATRPLSRPSVRDELESETPTPIQFLKRRIEAELSLAERVASESNGSTELRSFAESVRHVLNCWRPTTADKTEGRPRAPLRVFLSRFYARLLEEPLFAAGEPPPAAEPLAVGPPKNKRAGPFHPRCGEVLNLVGRLREAEGANEARRASDVEAARRADRVRGVVDAVMLDG